MLRHFILVIIVGFAGCATQLQVIGPYATRLSQSDIQQITSLITPRKELVTSTRDSTLFAPMKSA